MGLIDKAKDALDGSEEPQDSGSSDTGADSAHDEGTIAGKRDGFSEQVETKNDTAQNAE